MNVLVRSVSFSSSAIIGSTKGKDLICRGELASISERQQGAHAFDLNGPVLAGNPTLPTQKEIILANKSDALKHLVQTQRV
jgi:hypothetical protein